MNIEEKRYNAMKTYFSSGTHNKTVATTHPYCGMQYYGKTYNVFSDGYSIVFTRKAIPIEMETFNEYRMNNNANDLQYLDVIPVIERNEKYEERIGKVDFNKLFTNARANGYRKAKKKDNPYLLRYHDCFLSLRLIDRAYSIIDNGKEADVFYAGEPYMPVKIVTNIGFALICPMNMQQSKYDSIIKYEEVNNIKIIFNIVDFMVWEF